MLNNLIDNFILPSRPAILNLVVLSYPQIENCFKIVPPRPKVNTIETAMARCYFNEIKFL